MLNNKKLTVWGVLAAVVLVLVVLKVVWIKKQEGLSVVYLSTGEVYVGELRIFPKMMLKNAYQLQVTKDAADPAKNSFGLQPVSQGVWAPKALYLVKKNVVFYGQLKDDSAIAKKLSE